MDECEEYIKRLYPTDREITQGELLGLHLVWDESARRCSVEYEGKLAITIQSIVGLKASLRKAEQKALEADRKAREDCAEIADGFGATELIGQEIADAIRATISEEAA